MNYSFIRRDGENRILSIHKLVQEVQRDELSSNENKTYDERAVNAVYEAFPEVEYANWKACERIIGCALVCAEYMELVKDKNRCAVAE